MFTRDISTESYSLGKAHEAKRHVKAYEQVKSGLMCLGKSVNLVNICK